MYQFNVILRIRQGSISGTIIGTQYIRHTNISIVGATYATPFDTGATMSVVDGSANGSLASPADTVYVCTAQVEKFLTGAALTHAKTITTSGTATAVELRA